MISIGIDVSKGKSTVAGLTELGEVIIKPFEVIHNKQELEALVNRITKSEQKT